MILSTEQAERLQVEEVFGLTGGESEAKPLRFRDVADGQLWTRSYWYDGVPDYVEREFSQWFWYDKFTIVDCCLYGEPPATIRARHGRLYDLKALYQSSGEHGCPFREAEIAVEHEYPVTVDTYGSPPVEHRYCAYCDEPPDAIACDGHGYVYLGDGWAELVYVARHKTR